MVKSLLIMSRPINVLIAIISVLITSFILKQDFCSKTIFITSFVVAGFTVFSNIINDIFDVKTDRINSPNKPFPSRKITNKNAIIFATLVFILSSIATFQLNENAKNLVLFIVFPIIITYTPVFKSVPLIGNILIGSILGCVFLFSELSLLGEINYLWIPALLATHLTVLRELLKDIEDHGGDCNAEIITFPVCFGIDHSLRLFFILSIFLLVWAGGLPFYFEVNQYYLPIFWIIFSPWLFIVLFFLFWKKMNNYHLISNLLKVATIFGLGVIITFRF